jgi:hypothetical protein
MRKLFSALAKHFRQAFLAPTEARLGLYASTFTLKFPETETDAKPAISASRRDET